MHGDSKNVKQLNTIGGNSVAFRDSGVQYKTYYLNVDADGIIYERSKEEKEGFEKYVNDKTQAVSYRRKHWSGLEGYLTGVRFGMVKMSDGVSVEMFSISFTDYVAGEKYILRFNMNTQNGSLNQYVRSFVQYSPNIDYTKKLMVNTMKREKEDKYAPGMFLFAYANAGLDGKDVYIKTYYKRDTNGWPPLEEVQVRGGGTKWDSTKMDDFAYEKLTEFVHEFDRRIGEVTREIKRGLFVAEPTEADIPQKIEEKEVEAPKAYREEATKQEPVPEVKASLSDYDNDLPF